jgi:hypothetical protein
MSRTSPPHFEHREHERQQQHIAADRRVEDGPPDALCGGVGRGVGLLAQVCRCVVASDRVLGEQESERNDIEPESEAVRLASEEAARVVDAVAEHEGSALVVVGHEDEYEDHDGGTSHMPPHGDVVDDGQQVTAEDVEGRDDDQHDEELPEDSLQGVTLGPTVTEEPERQVEEIGAAVGDGGDDRQQPDQVEPAGVVAGPHAAQLAGPPVDAARRRVGRHELRHAEADHQDER